jgi:PTH1 family peptidyl-tRNA hydrolase
MKLIVGLGNPGDKYDGTRHNVGFAFLDELRVVLGAQEFEAKGKFQAEITVLENQAILVKPQTFMNQSGIAVKAAANFYKIDPKDIIVVHDDLDIILGEYKLQKGVSPKLHYGIQSVDAQLGTVDYWRLRIGIDNRTATQRPSGEEYVLNKFEPNEKEILKPIFIKLSEIITSHINNG